MCNFLSALILRDGSVLCNPMVDSHSTLIDAYAPQYPQLVNDNAVNSDRATFIRVEFKPESYANLDRPEHYRLHVDETYRPNWFDEDMEAQTVSRLHDIVTKMIVSADGQTVISGCWIVAGDKSVVAHSARVMAAGNSRVVARDSSSVEAWDSSRVVARDSSSVVARDSSSVVAWDSSRVVARGLSGVVAFGSSSVEAWDSSRVVARDSSRVEARDSSRVEARDSSRVEACNETPCNRPTITDNRKAPAAT